MHEQRSRQDPAPRLSEHDPPPPEGGLPVALIVIVAVVVIAAVVLHLTGVISPEGH
jgi:hypothetical protein